MTEFTPGLSALGGTLIGLSAALGYVLFGRVVGISGLVVGAFKAQGFALFFLLGLLTGPVIALFVFGDLHGFTPPPMWAIIVGGLLVGLGTRMGSGCTSGHGICGIARLSPRSLVATCTFVAAGVLLVGVARHAMGVL